MILKFAFGMDKDAVLREDFSKNLWKIWAEYFSKVEKEAIVKVWVISENVKMRVERTSFAYEKNAILNVQVEDWYGFEWLLNPENSENRYFLGAIENVE